MLHRTFQPCCFLQLLIEFGTSLLQIRLCDIEDVVNLQFWIYVIIPTLFLCHLLVVIVFDTLLRLFVNDGKGCDEDWETLLSFKDCYLRKSLAIVVLDLLLTALFVLDEVQTCYSVKGAEHWQFISLLLTVKKVFMSTMQISYKRVKTCYKIKINSRESKSCFYGFSGIKATFANHQKPHSALIAPLLQSKSVTIARQYLRYWVVIAAL